MIFRMPFPAIELVPGGFGPGLFQPFGVMRNQETGAMRLRYFCLRASCPFSVLTGAEAAIGRPASGSTHFKRRMVASARRLPFFR